MSHIEPAHFTDGFALQKHNRAIQARRRAAYKPPVEVSRLQADLTILKADRDQYRALVETQKLDIESLKAANVTLAIRLERFTNRLSNLQHEAVVAVDEAELQTANAERTRLSIDRIIKVCCEFFEVKRTEMISARRTQDLAYPRHVAMHVCKEMTVYSLPRIGRMFGGRDHTTVHHGHQKILSLRRCDPKVDADVKEICARLVA